jgi:hypothetical protein
MATLTQVQKIAGDVPVVGGAVSGVVGVISGLFGHDPNKQRAQDASNELSAALNGDLASARKILNDSGLIPGRGSATSVGKSLNQQAWGQLQQQRPDVAQLAMQFGPLAKGETDRSGAPMFVPLASASAAPASSSGIGTTAALAAAAGLILFR